MRLLGTDFGRYLYIYKNSASIWYIFGCNDSYLIVDIRCWLKGLSAFWGHLEEVPVTCRGAAGAGFALSQLRLGLLAPEN